MLRSNGDTNRLAGGRSNASAVARASALRVPVALRHRLGARLAATAIAMCAAAGVAAAAPGDLDPGFGVGGVATTQFGPYDNRAYALVIQPDGRIIAAGNSGSGHFALARFKTDGNLDDTFGTGGQVVADIGGYSEAAMAIALQPDGRIVAAGTTAPGGYCCQMALARFNADGTLDATFGTGGRVMTPLSGITEARALAIQADGKIVAAGGTFDPFSQDALLFRYNPDGSLDAGFGAGGKVKTDFGGYDGYTAVVIQADGRIVAVGAGGPGNDFMAARYNPDGSLDAGFGAAGKVVLDDGTYERAEAVAIQPDHKLVLAGTGLGRFALARLDPDGGLDPTFGTGGRATTLFTGDNLESATGLAIQPDGGIVAGGWAFAGYSKSFALARFRSDGNLDTGFGTGGRVTNIFPGHYQDGAEAAALQADGKIVLAGGYGSGTPPAGFVVARYLGGASNAPPDCSGARASEETLWPADHRWVPITLTGVTDPEGDAVSVQITRVSQDEPLGGGEDDADDDAVRPAVSGDATAATIGHRERERHGDGGGRCADARIDENGSVFLRAERSSHGDGRVYSIAFRASDNHGGLCEDSVRVCVPRRERGRHAEGPSGCVDNGQKYNSLGPCGGRHEHDWQVSAQPTLTLVSRAGTATALEYSLPAAGEVSVAVYDIAGRRVAILEQGAQSAGTHGVTWDARGVARGMYFCRVQAGSLTSVRSVLILR